MTDFTNETDDRAYEIGGQIEGILDALNLGDRDSLVAVLEEMHPADIADSLEQIEPDARLRLLEYWGADLDGRILPDLDEVILGELIQGLSNDAVKEAVRNLETDDVVDIVEDIDEPQQERVLNALDDPDRAAVVQSLQYPEDSAARLMQRELVAAPVQWSVGDLIDYLREAGDLPERFYHVYVVEPNMRPVGKVALSRLMASPRDVSLTELVDTNYDPIPATRGLSEVAYAFKQYHMVSAPVVDDAGRLVGVITIDDALDVLEEEADEDMRRLAGVGGEESLNDGVVATSRQRFPWLVVNLLTSILASLVIAMFTSTIEAVVALAVLMPIVASMGGNAGTQTLTIAVRALATKDLTETNKRRVIWREINVGLLNGLMFAAIAGLVGLIWFGSPILGAVLGLAMIGNLFVAGLSGIFIPLGLDRFGLDPALASGVFVTTVTDVVGFFCFLALAALILL